MLPTLAPTSFDALIVDLPYSSGGLHIGTKQQSTRRKDQGSGVQLRRQDFDGDSRDQVSFQAWATDVLRAGYRVLKRSAVFAVFSDWRQSGPMAIAAQCAGFVLRGIAVWDKTEAARPSPGRFRKQCEFILWGSKGELPADVACRSCPACCATSSASATSTPAAPLRAAEHGQILTASETQAQAEPAGAA